MIKTLETFIYTRVWPTRYALALILAVAVTAWIIHPAHSNEKVAPVPHTQSEQLRHQRENTPPTYPCEGDTEVCVLHD